MMWFIVSLVTAAIFGAQPHIFTSNRHFITIEECMGYMEVDAGELLLELRSSAPDAKIVDAKCIKDTSGTPI